MALANYTDLQASALDWMERAGQTGQAVDWIALAEAKLNRKLGPVETDASRTGTVDSRSISISALTVVEPIALFIADPSGSSERELQQQAAATMSYDDNSGRPSQWAMDSATNLKLDRPCDQAYSFRFRFRERFALSGSVTTNWLLTNHPDVYLAATLMWGAGYNQDWPNGAVWKGILDDGLEEVGNIIAETRRGVLRADPALAAIGNRGRFYDGSS